MSEANHIPPEAEEVPADSTPAEEAPPSPGRPVTITDASWWVTCPACGQRGPMRTVGAEDCDSCRVKAPPSYLEMFEEYLAGQDWIGPAETPLVFHLKRLCAQLDRDPLAPAAVSSAYLQAFSRLDRRRPGAPQGDGLVPPGAQPSIFDEMD